MCRISPVCFSIVFLFFIFFFFFFQAEDGIRDTSVTGVQTCALPIYGAAGVLDLQLPGHRAGRRQRQERRQIDARSEERRVGKECRSRWWPEHEEKKRERRKEWSRTHVTQSDEHVSAVDTLAQTTGIT